MRTATHNNIRFTMSDTMMVRPTRLMTKAEISEYVNSELLREGFDMSRPVTVKKGLCDCVVSQEL